MNIKHQVFPESYELCGKTERLCKTNFKSLFVNYQGGFAMPGGELQTKEYSSNAYQFSIDNTSQVPYTSLSFSEVNDKWVGAQPGVLSARIKLITNCTWEQNWIVSCTSTPSN